MLRSVKVAAKPLSGALRQCRHFSRDTELRDAESSNKIDVDALLSKPTWSVASLLPPKEPSQVPQEQAISSKQLHHLLRLSALPRPKDHAEEEKMLSTLTSQLHFVKEIQKVDTTGVEPLRSLRDETEQGRKEVEIGMDKLKEALEKEEVRGEFHRRIRRKSDVKEKERQQEWDPLGMAERKVGRFFVVEGGKER